MVIRYARIEQKEQQALERFSTYVKMVPEADAAWNTLDDLNLLDDNEL